MKVLLAAVNAKYIHSNLAVYSLKAYAERFGIRPGIIEIAEYTINHQRDRVLMDLYRKKPDILAFSCYIWNIDYVKALAAELHKLLPDTELWLGGPEVSYDAGAVLEVCPGIRGIMRGEGEQTFLELMEYYQDPNGHCLQSIRGITVRMPKEEKEAVGEKQADCFRETPDRELTPLDQIPFVYQDLKQFENRILYYETSRGCPFSCAYCLSSIDKSVRFRSFSLVREELDFFLNNRVRQVKFVDRTFNCSRVHSMEIWSYLAEHDNGVTNFHFEISADLLGDEELKLFKTMRPGLIQLEIGVQSTNPETIRSIRRTMNLTLLSRNVRAVHEMGNIHQHLDLIAGLPGEDYDSFRRSYRDVYALKPQQLQLGFLKVLKGSSMHEKAQEYGIVYKEEAPYEVLYTRWLSYEDVIRLKAVEEMTEIYYNSGQFVHTMRRLSGEFENPFDLYEALGAYYERNALDQKNHSRISRYDILLAFIREQPRQDPDREELYRELLVLDLYLRENMKSRPSWAEDQSSYKDAFAAFFHREVKEKTYLKEYEGVSPRQLANRTHLEVFRYPVLLPEAEDPAKTLKKGIYPVLFDYERKDPLTQDAAVHLLLAEDLFPEEMK